METIEGDSLPTSRLGSDKEPDLAVQDVKRALRSVLNWPPGFAPVSSSVGHQERKGEEISI